MITIEEKLKLFTKIVYDKVEKQNQLAIDKFNFEYGNMIEQRKTGFDKLAAELESEGLKTIEKEKIKILSRAKIDEKRIILESQKKIFSETLDLLFKYASEFTEDEEYHDILIKDLDAALNELESDCKIDLYITLKDKTRFEGDIINRYRGHSIHFKVDDSLIGGFIIIDSAHNVKIDMSISNRLMSSKGLIGEKLFCMLR